MQPLVSIITINFNQLKLTCEMLDSLRKLSWPAVEIIVVDNHSAEDPTTVITERYPEVKLIVSKENLGFAGGNNLGIQASKGEYLFFLNNDLVMLPGWLEPMLALFHRRASAAIVGNVQLNHATGAIDHTGIFFNPKGKPEHVD